MLQNIVSANEQADLKKFRETFLNTVDGCSTERICRKIKTKLYKYLTNAKKV